MSLRLFDAHNHLHDPRLGTDPGVLLAKASREGVAAMVVNGSCEEDWPAVLDLARKHSQVIPSFGYHPWYVRERTAAWKEVLIEFLDRVPSAVGEIGLDRWIKDPDLSAQQEIFVGQMHLVAERELPASIHCLQAWGLLYDLLRDGPRPGCGFVLHSFGGPVEMIPALEKLGAYFSLPGYFAHERKSRQREAFVKVPLDRLLIETDAPDQSLPESRVLHPLPPDANGKPVNHPANLRAVYEFASELRGIPLEELAGIVEANFRRVFGAFTEANKGNEAPL
jgi:TatD DNase family protein